MGNNNQKIMTVAFVIVAGLVYLVVSLLISTFAATFAVIARLSQGDIVHHGVPVAVGVLTFSLLQFNPTITTWAEEVVVELKKVVWPTREQTIGMTIVVCVMVLISGLILGLFDVVSGQTLNSGIGLLAGMFK
jgi:preprotein translocase subunit SecE